MNTYEVIVGNIGSVHCGPSKAKALKHYREYVSQSKSQCGRAGGEEVTLFCNDEIIREFSFGVPTEEAY